MQFRSMSDSQRTGNVQRRLSLSRVAGVVAAFVLAGPPIGGLAATTLFAASIASSESVGAGSSGGGLGAWVAAFLATMKLGLAYGLPLSYLFGAAPAVLVGLATALWDARTGAISATVALGGALLLGGIVALAQADPSLPAKGGLIAPAAILLAHLSGAAVGWLLARAVFDRPGREPIEPPRRSDQGGER